MTGFGRHEETIGGRHVIVEIKSVNHKYFEFSLRISRGFAFLEDKIKSFVQNRVSRGKIEVYVHIDNIESSQVQVEVNHPLVCEYLKAFNEIKDKYSINSDVSLELLSKYNDILAVRKTPEDEELVLDCVSKVCDKALDAFIFMRETEGKRLCDDILSRAKQIMSLVKEIEVTSPQTVNAYKARLEARLTEILADRNIDEQRILTECAIFADKIAVDEETVRLKSHFKQLEKFITADGAIGRKMDFLIQEMNREANTIGSKCTDSKISYMVVDIKSEIEKIREQVQNIE